MVLAVMFSMFAIKCVFSKSMASPVVSNFMINTCELQTKKTFLLKKKHIMSAIKSNCFFLSLIRRARRSTKQREGEQERQQPTGKDFLAYVKGVTDKIIKILKQHKISSIFAPYGKANAFSLSLKDKITLEAQRMSKYHASLVRSLTSDKQTDAMK